MPLTQIDVHHVRVIQQARVDAHPFLNVIAGANASGKSSFLEAIHLLGTGRSFRTMLINEVIQRGADALAVMGRQRRLGVEQVLGFRRGRASKEIRINGHPEPSVAALARALPVQVISPESHHHFFEDAKERRRLLNWGLFHMEPHFYEAWLRYQRLLRQRNSDLRRGAASFRAWEPELVQVGEAIHARQVAQITAWEPEFQRHCALLLGEGEARLGLVPGWPRSLSLAEAVRAATERDRERGYTGVGVHRSDLALVFRGEPLAKLGSHGQQKLALIALKLAQLTLFVRNEGGEPVLIVDDLAAELDENSRERVLHSLAAIPIQVFLSALTPALAPPSASRGLRLFHVEHGQIHAAD